MALPMGIREVPQGEESGKSHRSNCFRVWLHELKGASGSQYPYGFGPVYVNEGLMKHRRGFTLAAAEENLGVGKGLRQREV